MGTNDISPPGDPPFEQFSDNYVFDKLRILPNGLCEGWFGEVCDEYYFHLETVIEHDQYQTPFAKIRQHYLPITPAKDVPLDTVAIPQQALDQLDITQPTIEVVQFPANEGARTIREFFTQPL